MAALHGDFCMLGLPEAKAIGASDFFIKALMKKCKHVGTFPFL